MTWNLNVADFVGAVESEHKNLMKAVAVRLLDILVHESPRDTGTYANNHHVSFNAPDARYTIRDRGNQGEVVSFFGGDQRAKVLGQPNDTTHTIYVQNNLPYAEYLEHGTDKMPAQNIYAKSVQIVKSEYS